MSEESTIGCGADGCANDGTFSQPTCPGSDDEQHHCVDCGQLWVNFKAECCDKCQNHWCPDWQNTFVSVHDCSQWDENDIGLVCATCFLADERLWCPGEPVCDCGNTFESVAKRLEEWTARRAAKEK